MLFFSLLHNFFVQFLSYINFHFVSSVPSLSRLRLDLSLSLSRVSQFYVLRMRCFLFCRAAFEHFVRVSAAERRRAERIMNGGSLGRNFNRNHFNAHVGGAQENHYESLERSRTFSSPVNSYKSDTGSVSSSGEKRRTSLRYSTWKNSQGSITRVLGFHKSRPSDTSSVREETSSCLEGVNPMASPSTSSEGSFNAALRPESPQSVTAVATMRRRPPHRRHRRVKSIGDISVTPTPVTPV
uniref:Uncharacterized protein n=1 Tax=Cacopsylla melanoneura TaxID=428564 RepID=A0A8D8VL90_9HEMI